MVYLLWRVPLLGCQKENVNLQNGLQVTIKSPEHYIETDSAQVPVYVDFGERVGGRLVVPIMAALV